MYICISHGQEMLVVLTSTVVEGIEHGKERANGEDICVFGKNHVCGWQQCSG